MTKRRTKKDEGDRGGRFITDSTGKSIPLPPGAVVADVSQQVSWNSWNGWQPPYYADVEFVCVDCGVEETWTAEDQKWYYEVAKGSLYDRAGRCLACRRWRRENLATVAGNWSAKGILRRIKAGLESQLQHLGYAPLGTDGPCLEYEQNDSRIRLTVERNNCGLPRRVIAQHVEQNENPSFIATLTIPYAATRVTDEQFTDWLKVVRKFARNEDRRL